MLWMIMMTDLVQHQIYAYLHEVQFFFYIVGHKIINEKPAHPSFLH